MPTVEYAVDVWDLTGIERKPDAAALLEHLTTSVPKAGELVWMAFNIDLARDAESHLLVFKRAGE